MDLRIEGAEMMEWVNTHGVNVMVGYLLFAAFVGSMPPLPENASYLARWGFGFLHMASMNLRIAFELFNLKLPSTED